MSSEWLSKSSLMAWRQCPKRLWLQEYRPELCSSESLARHKFMIGNEVGEFARNQYPGGVLIEDGEIGAAALATSEATEAYPDRAIFEATYVSDGLAVRTDLLLPTADGYRLVEVKSGTGMKPHYIDDCAIQTWVLQQNKVKLASVELAFINTDFVYQGGAYFDALFSSLPLESNLALLVNEVPQWLEAARHVLAGEEPDIRTGPQCELPYECPFRMHCSASEGAAVQTEFPLEILYRMRASTRDELRAQGYEDVRNVPENILNDLQRRIQRVSRSGTAELLPAAKNLLDELPFPRYYLDFETITFAIPRWVGTSPYRSQIPFQWSCHVESEAGALRHVAFLDTSGDDPRREFAVELIKALGSEGVVFVYNQSFEKSRIAELANLFPEFAPALTAINRRIVDLLPIARDHYYHPAMQGSWSIKAVLPTIAPDLDYHRLLVGNGSDAQAAYLEIIHARTSAARKAALIDGLDAYCALDTMAMVRLAWFFQGIQVYVFSSTTADQFDGRTGSDGAPADAEMLAAVAALRKHCTNTGSSLITGPVSLLQRTLRTGYRQTVELRDRLERSGILLHPQAACLASDDSRALMPQIQD